MEQKQDFSLQKADNNQVALTKTANEIIIARQSQLFESFPDSKKMEGLENMIKIAHLDSGRSIPGQSDQERALHVTAIASRLVAIIPEKFKGITGAEIRIACRNGGLGLYGEIYQISPKLVIEWIEAYIAERGKFTLLSAPSKPIELKEPTPEEWRNIMAGKLLRCYEQVKNGVEPVDYGNVLFKFLREKKLIELTSEDIESYMEQAKAVVIAKNDPAAANTFSERIDRRNMIKLITEQSGKALVVSEARNIALKEFLMFVDDIEELRKTILSDV